MKAEALRQSGKLESKACEITGSTDEHMKIWIVPTAMTSHIDRDTKGAAAFNADEGNLEDLRMLDKMSIRKGETDQLQDELPTTVKSEPPPSADKPKCPEELAQEELEKFNSDAPTLYRRSCS